MSQAEHNLSAPSGSTLPLAGIRVVDLATTFPGALVTQFLADAGADVVLVEPPGGVALRRHPGWPALGRGKRSMVADLAVSEDRAAVLELVAGADITVDTFSPSTAQRLHLAPEDLSAGNPRLVVASITG